MTGNHITYLVEVNNILFGYSTKVGHFDVRPVKVILLRCDLRPEPSGEGAESLGLL